MIQISNIDPKFDLISLPFIYSYIFFLFVTIQEKFNLHCIGEILKCLKIFTIASISPVFDWLISYHIFYFKTIKNHRKISFFLFMYNHNCLPTIYVYCYWVPWRDYLACEIVYCWLDSSLSLLSPFISFCILFTFASDIDYAYEIPFTYNFYNVQVG